MSRKTKSWTLLSNHAHVLVCLMREPKSTMRDVSIMVGITERAVQGIVADLQHEGYIEKEKDGRCNCYKINRDSPLRHDLESDHTIGELLELLI